MPGILITGATGTIGGQIASMILDKGVEVAVATRDSRRADHLSERGATVVTLDLEKPRKLKKKLTGIKALFLVGLRSRTCRPKPL